MYTLFPDIRPYAVHNVKVDVPHALYVEECGNSNGKPVLVLHGGPGFGSQPFHRRFFDPDRYRIILFDQRGCGRSSPHGLLKGNTADNLVADIEAIRKYLKVDSWAIFGGGWGATLALLYAQAQPEHVKALILRGVFLARPEDIDWFYKEGANRIFPDFWQNFIKILSDNELEHPIGSFHNKLTGSDELARMAAAKAWAAWSGRCATLRPYHTVLDQYMEPHTAMSLARITSYFVLNQYFMKPNQILDNMNTISQIPGTIIHGRYDMVCPLEQAQLLHQSWENSQLHIIRDAGHAEIEASVVDALVRATEDLAMHLDDLA